MLDFRRLVDNATERGRQAGWVYTAGARVSPQDTGYGRYMYLFGTWAWFGIDFELWAGSRDTPLWIWMEDDDLKVFGPGEVYPKSNGDKYVPLELPVGIEQDEVVSSIASQLEEIGHSVNPDFDASQVGKTRKLLLRLPRLPFR